MPEISPAGRGRPTPDGVIRQRGTPAERVGTGRALVVVGPPPQAAGGARSGTAPSAAFLAHLIATAQGSPQTRVRRRAGPAEALAAYGAGRAQPAMQPGGRFSTAV